MFEPGTRNTGTAIAGKNVANPVAMLNAAVDMLYHLGHRYHADCISDALHKTIDIDGIHTPGNVSKPPSVGRLYGIATVWNSPELYFVFLSPRSWR